MRLPTLLRKRGAPAQIGGVVRLDRRTKNLTKRLRPARSPSSTTVIWIGSAPRRWWSRWARRGQCGPIGVGPLSQPRPRHPARGGHPVDRQRRRECLHPIARRRPADASTAEVAGPHGGVVAEGTLNDRDAGRAAGVARVGLADQIEAFADNTMTYLRLEKELLLEGVGVPDVVTRSRAGMC